MKQFRSTLPDGFNLPKRLTRLSELAYNCGGRGSPKRRASLAALILIYGNVWVITRS